MISPGKVIKNSMHRVDIKVHTNGRILRSKDDASYVFALDGNGSQTQTLVILILCVCLDVPMKAMYMCNC